MRYIFIYCFLALLMVSVEVQGQLSEEARISVLISEPHDEEVFTVFGHAAFRVHDPVQGYDAVFNYGIFDFSKPNFIWRFALGETDYMLRAYDYKYYLPEYQLRGSDVTELQLNLTQKEKDDLYEALRVNELPENRVYRYNFFFDNCATRLPVMTERYVDGEVVYASPQVRKTFRQMVHDCTRENQWLTFGIDLALGSPADRMATPHEMMFLPEYVKQEFLQAQIIDPDGKERPLVSQAVVTRGIEDDQKTTSVYNRFFTPLVTGWVLFAVVACLTFWGVRRGRPLRGVDIVLFSLAGIAGCVLFFLCFVSTHPCISPNWSVVWLHPFHLIGVVLFSLKRTKRAAYWYHFINFAALLILLVAWWAIPQQMNAAFIPFILTLALRSASVRMNGKLTVDN